jgi:hypothetical protein
VDETRLVTGLLAKIRGLRKLLEVTNQLPQAVGAVLAKLAAAYEQSPADGPEPSVIYKCMVMG